MEDFAASHMTHEEIYFTQKEYTTLADYCFILPSHTIKPHPEAHMELWKFFLLNVVAILN